jgi:hypothetical protein
MLEEKRRTPCGFGSSKPLVTIVIGKSKSSGPIANWLLQNYAAPAWRVLSEKERLPPAGRWSIMDDSQANNDNRAERHENRTQELVQRKKAEHDELQRLLKERVEEMNANHGNLPQFVVRGASIVQLGHIDMHLEFDPVFSNPTEFVLVLKVS